LTFWERRARASRLLAPVLHVPRSGTEEEEGAALTTFTGAETTADELMAGADELACTAELVGLGAATVETVEEGLLAGSLEDAVELPLPSPQNVMTKLTLSVWQATWTVVSSGT